MLSVRDHISPTIAEQFPALYREEGDFLVEFVKAYYEHNESIMDRNVPKLRDVDTTLASFLIFFKKKYLQSLPLDTVVDTRFIIKHIQDLYKRKGSEESLRLLFRMFFDEDIEVFYPSTAILKPSDSIWGGAVYLELKTVASVENYPIQRGDKLRGSISNASGFVDDIIFVNFSGALTPITYLSNLSGTFITDDSFFVTRLGVTNNYGKILSGSISEVNIKPSQRTSGQNVGDKIKLISPQQGTSATGTVRTISTNTTGKIDFDLLDGGFGYSTASASASAATKAEKLALNDKMTSNQVMIVSGATAIASIKVGNYILAEAATGSKNTVISGGGRVVAYNHPLLYFKTEDRTKAQFLQFVKDQLSLAIGGSSTVNSKMLSIFNRETEDLSTNYRLGDISNSGYDFISDSYITSADLDLFEKYRTSQSLTSAQTNWIEDRLLPAIYASGFGYKFNLLAADETVNVKVEDNNSVPVTTISAYNDSGTFDISSISDIEPVNVITDFIGDFTSKPLAVIINASAMVESGIYEIETVGTSATNFTAIGANNATIGTRFIKNSTTATGNGTVTDVVATNYGMSGDKEYENFNGETLNTKLEDAFKPQAIVIGSISAINPTNTGFNYVNDVFNEIEYIDVSRFDKRDAIITFTNPDFILEAGDIVTQVVQIEDPEFGKNPNADFVSGTSNQIVYYTAKGRFLKREGNDFYFRQLSFYDFDEAYTITIKGKAYALTGIRPDINSLPMGKNANISGQASYEKGQIDSINIDNTGYRYSDGEDVSIINSAGSEVAKATVRTLGIGKTEGKWKSSTSFLSDDSKYLHDNDYYQEYSYDISTIIDPDLYNTLIKDTVGVAGTKVFSSPLINSVNDLNSKLDVEFQVWNLSNENLMTEGSGSVNMKTEFNADTNNPPVTTVRPGYTGSDELVAQIIQLDTSLTDSIETSIGT